MRKFLLAFLLLTSPALAQTVQQSGTVSPNHPACWVTTGIIQDCGVPAVGPYLLTSPPFALTDATTVTPDLNQAQVFSWTVLAPGRQLNNPLNISANSLGQRMIVYFVQGGSGTNTVTSWGSVYKFSGGTKPTLSTAVGALDRMTCEIEATTVFTCTFTANFQ